MRTTAVETHNDMHVLSKSRIRNVWMNDQSKESSFLHSKDLTETPPPPPTQTQREEKGKENRKQEENEKSLFKIRWNDSYEFHA